MPTDYKTFKEDLLKDPLVRKEYEKLKPLKLKCCSCGADGNLCKIIGGKLFCQKCINGGKVKRRNATEKPPNQRERH